MNKVATVKVLENGEIRIPKEIREDLSLKTGTKLLVVEGEDNVLLKRFDAPSLEERFEKLVKQTRKEFRKRKITRKDLEKAIRLVRSRTSKE